MLELIQPFLPHIATVGAVLLPTIPMLIKRGLNDKKVTKLLSNATRINDIKLDIVERLVEKVSQKELELRNLVLGIQEIFKKIPDLTTLVASVEMIKNKFNEELELLQSNNTKVFEVLKLDNSIKDTLKLIINMQDDIKKIKSKIGG